MRWIAVAVAVLGLIGVFVTHSSGVLFLSLLTIAFSGLVAVFLFAQARIEGSARPDVYTPTPEEVAAIRKAAEARRAAAAGPVRRDSAGAGGGGGMSEPTDS